ncbi:MAG: GHKL domain-containing protein [Oscillospiraceae bacterium]|nr:GHKL domain-containing protein [Oscillospiraceae bacterium]
MGDVWEAFEILINIAYSFIFSEFIIKYFKFKNNIRYKKIWFCLLTVLLFVAITLNNYYLHFKSSDSFIYGIITFLYAIIFLNGNIFEKLFITIIEYSMIAVINFLIILLMSGIFSDDTNSIITMTVSIVRFISIISAILLYWGLTKLLLLFKRNNDKITNRQWILVVSASFLSFIIIIFMMDMTLNDVSYNLQMIYTIFAIILIFFLNIIIFIVTSIINKSNNITLENTLLKQSKIYEEKNAENIQIMYNKIRTLKHDMKYPIEDIYTELNNIKPIADEDSKKHIESINSYLQDINGELNKISTNINTGNMALDNIISYKTTIAKEREIEIVSKVTYKIVGISDVDLSILIGNLLDNAMEACEKLKNTEKKINLKIFKDNHRLKISVENPVEESVLNKNPDLISTKKEKEYHGIGIKSIKTIVEKYHGLIKYTEEDNSIFAEIMLTEIEN